MKSGEREGTNMLKHRGQQIGRLTHREELDGSN